MQHKELIIEMATAMRELEARQIVMAEALETLLGTLSLRAQRESAELFRLRMERVLGAQDDQPSMIAMRQPMAEQAAAFLAALGERLPRP
jgi:hypothetical protein